MTTYHALDDDYRYSETEDLAPWIIICSDLAPVASILFYLSPLPTMVQVIRYKSTLGMPLLSHSLMVVSAYIWFLYGILEERRRISIPCGVGMVLGVSYFCVLARYKRTVVLPKWFHVLYAGVIMLTMTCLTVVLDRNEAEVMIGDMAVAFNLMLFAAPLSAFKTVCKAKNSRSIPLPVAVASIITCTLWIIIGAGKQHDKKVYLPNILGLLLGCAQVAVKLYYWDCQECGCGGTDGFDFVDYEEYLEYVKSCSNSSLAPPPPEVEELDPRFPVEQPLPDIA